MDNDLLKMGCHAEPFPVFFGQIHATTASYPFPQGRYPATFSVIVGRSYA
jgi:hypothetical protein